MTISNNSLDALDVILQLKEAKTDLASRLSQTKVTVLEKDHPEIIAAIKGLFGNSYVNNGIAVITFDMISECMKIVRTAGKGKAQELIK